MNTDLDSTDSDEYLTADEGETEDVERGGLLSGGIGEVVLGGLTDSAERHQVAPWQFGC